MALFWLEAIAQPESCNSLIFEGCSWQKGAVALPRGSGLAGSHILPDPSDKLSPHGACPWLEAVAQPQGFIWHGSLPLPNPYSEIHHGSKLLAVGLAPRRKDLLGPIMALLDPCS